MTKWIVGVLIGMGAYLGAQDSQPVVMIPVTVIDPFGRGVVGLERTNFKVADDASEQKLLFFQATGGGSYTLGFAFLRLVDSRTHSILVTADGKGLPPLTVRSRSQYTASADCKADDRFPGFSCVY